jgi:hypothetical protein
MKIHISLEHYVKPEKIAPKGAFAITIENRGVDAVKIFRDYVLSPGTAFMVDGRAGEEIATEIDLVRIGAGDVNVWVFRKTCL